MGAKLTIRYDRVGDILYIDKVPPYEEQECDELEDGILVRVNPSNEEVEGLDILFYSKRLSQSESLELPVEVALRLAT